MNCMNFSTSASAPIAKAGYASNYNGTTFDRYDSQNPTYRQGPPAGLVMYEQRGFGGNYLNYYKDPMGRW